MPPSPVVPSLVSVRVEAKLLEDMNNETGLRGKGLSGRLYPKALEPDCEAKGRSLDSKRPYCENRIEFRVDFMGAVVVVADSMVDPPCASNSSV